MNHESLQSFDDSLDDSINYPVSDSLHDSAIASPFPLLPALHKSARRVTIYLANAFAAAILALVFLPAIIVAVLVLLASGGPVFYRQTRVGRGGEPFQVCKFRTMRTDAAQVLETLLARDPALAAEWRSSRKLRHDPRVTTIGRFLRRSSLDELPQLWNILRGEMQLVGPRPVEPPEIAMYGRHARHYFACKPGLTGLWQVSGRSEVSYARRVALDAFYARRRSVFLDLQIIGKTVGVVILGRGAR